MPFSLINGLVVEAPWELPGRLLPPTPPDVVMRFAPVERHGFAALLAQTPWVTGASAELRADADGAWLLTLPGSGAAWFSADRRTVDLDFGDEQEAKLLAAGSLIALCNVARGTFVLHAAAVVVDGVAIAIAGPSGAGKSSTAALLARAGHPVIADDALALELTEGRVRCHRGSTTLRLRSGMRSLAASAPAVETQVDGRLGATFAVGPSEATDSWRLGAIVVPRLVADQAPAGAERLAGAAALTALTSSLRIAGWAGDEFARQAFSDLAALAANVPTIRCDIPRGGVTVPAALDALLTAATA